jgi:uncharacterized protein (TIGR02594 family)
LDITPYKLAERFVGIRELAGAAANHPLIQWWLSLCGLPLEEPDETPWCSAFVNGIAWELRLPRSKSAAARSWLTVGTPVALEDARPGFDIVVFTRTGNAPGPEVLNAPGHVAFFAGLELLGTPSSEQRGSIVLALGGNQSDGVSIARFPVLPVHNGRRVLGVRRLA